MSPKAPDKIRTFLVRSFYQFRSLTGNEVKTLQKEYQGLGAKLELSGTVLLAEEGCNGTIAGSVESVEAFFRVLQSEFPEIKGQDSHCQAQPFNRWKVPIKKQIVQARDAELQPSCNFDGQKSPQEWDEVRHLVRRGKAQMIDVRNTYEVEIGTFPEAIDPGTNTFKQFSDFLDQEVGISLQPELPTAIFCTGGIRCEKARMDLERRGFSQVLQLKGGILRYLKTAKEPGFEGECFVFDDRVALDSDLEPTTAYQICPRCSGPCPTDGTEHDCSKGRVRP